MRTSSNVLVWHEVHLSHSCKSLLIWHGTLPKSNKVPCLGKQRAFQDTCFSAPPSLWAALPRKYLPLVFIYKYYKNRPQKTPPKTRTYPWWCQSLTGTGSNSRQWTASSCWNSFSLCWTTLQLTNLRFWCHIWIAKIDPRRKPSGRADTQSEPNRSVTRQGKTGSFKIKQNIFWVLNVTHPFTKARASQLCCENSVTSFNFLLSFFQQIWLQMPLNEIG